MDVREKLVEIMTDFYGSNPMHYGVKAKMLADHLIAHGVTVQEWISVKDRLPEDGQTVLTYKSGICDILTYEAQRNGWISGSWFWSMDVATHWMPQPQPPKGE